MDRRYKQHAEQQGQAIVIMVFAIIAMAALVGLAIDGGRLYTIRRQVQNGADAAALAGTRELAQMIAECAEPSYAYDMQVAGKVLEFANLNGVEETSPDGDVTAWYVDAQGDFLGWVGTGTIPTYSTGVGTRLVATDTTTFIRLFGIDTISAPGEALAMAGPVKTFGGGLLPIAVPLERLNDIGEGNTFQIKKNGDICDETDCGDPEDENMPQAQRGWLQLGHIFNDAGDISDRVYTGSYGGQKCSPDKLQPLVDHIGDLGVAGWVDPDCPYPLNVHTGHLGHLDGDYIAGITGENTDALNEVDNEYDVDDLMVIPIFDYIYTGYCDEDDDEHCMETEFDGNEPDVGWMTGQSAYYYHIVGFVTVKFKGVDHSAHEMHGEFVTSVVRPGEIQPSAGLGNGMCIESLLIGVALWE
ncbi:MAG: hypothetical protein JXA14_05640 [Anaerolineae bacterium]|nr:hypothetical protein [Anaerolineae bacterium]